MSYMNEDLEMYISTIKENKVLDSKEQKVLVEKAQNGDESARENLILSNMRFVFLLALKYKYANIPLGELISEGNMGLIEAIDKFDLAKENNFVSYAAWWIKHFIERCIHQFSGTVRLPMNKVRLVQQVKREKDYVSAHRGVQEEEALDIVGDYMNLDRTELAKLIEASQNVFSLDQEKNQDTKMTFLESLEAVNSESIEEVIENEESYQILSAVMNNISEREADIIRRRYGLEGNIPQSLNEISKVYGITKERVRQIEMKGMEKLKVKLSEEESLVA